jgi:predicted metalloprotease with PDZ domain
MRRHRMALRAGTILAIAIFVACVPACTAFVVSNDLADPFILYGVHLKDHSLKVVEVTGQIFGSVERSVRLRPFGLCGGDALEPIGFCAVGPGGNPLRVKRADGVYIVESNGADFTFSYDVVLTVEDRYSPEIRSMLTFFDGDRCRLLGKDIFLMPELRLAEGIIVDFDLFGDSILQTPWSTNGKRMLLPSLDELPLTMAVSGDFRITRERIGGTEIRLAIAGDWPFDDGEFFGVLRKIVSHEMALFGSAPHERYLFVCDRNPVKGGGKFEHYGIHFTAGMILLLDPRIDRSDLYGPKMAIVAHEFFHNWNGEAVRPEDGDMLWFIEGATVYFSYQILLETQLMTREQYRARHEMIRQRYVDNPYLGTVAIGGSGNDDLADKDMVNLLYDGGFLAAEALEKELRTISSGEKGLIDVIKLLYETGSTVDESVLVRAIEDIFHRNLLHFISAMIDAPAPEILVEPPPAS